MADDWITTAEAASLSGYHPERVRELMREGKVFGQKFGLTWQVDRVSLLAYLEEMEKKGDRRGPKPNKT